MNLDQVILRMKEIVLEVGKYQLELHRSNKFKIDKKSTQTDLVTEVDKESERMILEKIREYYPLHNILTEESGAFEKHSDYTWIIDPLDGTNNYASGLPIFGISIALAYKEKSIAGVVYLPYLDDLYEAYKGNGAFCNGVRIHCGKTEDLIESIVATGFPYDKHISNENNLDNVNNIVPKIRGIRRLGSAAYDICLVAHGIYDAYWELGIQKWDMAAGQIILEESGGIVEILEHKRPISLIAGNAKIIDSLKNEIIK